MGKKLSSEHIEKIKCSSCTFENNMVFTFTSVLNDNKIEKHEVTPEGDYAVFETDHFSTYTLTIDKNAKEDTPNPPTGDKIMLYIILFGISVVGVVRFG